MLVIEDLDLLLEQEVNDLIEYINNEILLTKKVSQRDIKNIYFKIDIDNEKISMKIEGTHIETLTYNIKRAKEIYDRLESKLSDLIQEYEDELLVEPDGKTILIKGKKVIIELSYERT